MSKSSSNKTIQIEIEDKIISNEETYEIDMIQKIVASMFKKYKEDFSNKMFQDEYSIDEQKNIISKFEKVIKCIRYQVMDIKEFYKKYDDNLELLVELSEVSSIKKSLENLVNEYLSLYKKEKLKIACITKENDKSKEIIKYFDSKKIDIDFKEEPIDNENSNDK